MEKKIYEKPVMQVERFVPNRYVATCGYDNEWKAKCRDVSCLIFYGGAENTAWTSDANRGGCGQSHTFKLADGAYPESNCWLLLNVRTRQPGTVTAYSTPYSNWFSHRGNQSGEGWVLDPDQVQTLKDNKQLVQGYYNHELLGEDSWLVTADLAQIHPSS